MTYSNKVEPRNTAFQVTFQIFALYWVFVVANMNRDKTASRDQKFNALFDKFPYRRMRYSEVSLCTSGKEGAKH